MNLTSFLANKCFEFLLNAYPEKERGDNCDKNGSGKGAAASPRSKLPPPWVRSIEIFNSNCNGCGNCIAGCETGILFQDAEGFPWVDFSRGSCSFCGKCAESCPQDVFDFGPAKEPWRLRAKVTLDCLTHNNVVCRTCVEHCEEDAIILPRKNGAVHAPHILSERCSGCGACYGPCPVGAIKIVSTVDKEKS